MTDSPFVQHADAQNFAQMVMQNSMQMLVLVDFYADWCEPCKTLTPILEKLANEMQGSFLLVKVNADESQAICQQLGVRSLPTVKFVKEGQIVDEFQGAVAESQVRAMINKHCSRQTEPYRQNALALQQQGQLDQAIDLMRQVVQHEPDFFEAQAELANMLVESEDFSGAAEALAQIPEGEGPKELIESVVAAIRMAQLQAETAGVDLSEYRAALEADPDNHEKRLEMGKILISKGSVEEGLQEYLTVMQKDRSYQDDAGRKALIEAFELLGPGEPLVKKFRNKMFNMLY